MPTIRGGFKIEKGKVVKGLDQLIEIIPIKNKKKKTEKVKEHIRDVDTDLDEVRLEKIESYKRRKKTKKYSRY